MRYSVSFLSATILLGATALASASAASAQSLRDDLDRMTGEAPAVTTPYSAQNPNFMGHDYTSDPRGAAAVQAVQTAAINQPAPDFSLIGGNAAAAGAPIGLRNIVAQGPSVILFAPGSVAYTSPLLGLLEKNLGNFQRVAVQPIAVSTDPVTVLSTQNYNYLLLSDPSGLAMRHYGAIKQGGMVMPVLVSIDANGTIVDMQETLTPDLNRAVAAIQRTQTLTAVSSSETIETVTVTTPQVGQPQELVQIQQATREDDVIVNSAGNVLGAREVLASTNQSIDIQPFPTQQVQVPQQMVPQPVMPQAVMPQQIMPQQMAPAPLIPAPGQAIPVIPPSFPQ